MNPAASRSLILTGASDGIGRALAIEFAKRGYSLGLIARRGPVLEEVKTLCLAAGAKSVHLAAVDVTDEPAFENALLSLDDSLGGAGIFVANAGVTGRTVFDQNSWPSARETLRVNVMAAIHGIEFMKVRMLTRGHGTLAGVSSIAGARGLPSSGAYSSSKAAFTAHLESLRVDLGDRGIAVVTIAPGFIDTPLTRQNKGWMPFLMDPETAAVRFADGIEGRRPWVVAPLPFRFIYPVLQMMPRMLFDLILRRTYRMIRGK